MQIFGNYQSKIKAFFSKTNRYSLGLYVLLFLGFLVRVANLNYNSAFNDEAIYIVIGRLGLFANDWWSYGAKLWMAGLPYIYPSLAALSYEAGGLVGARLLNVIFGVIFLEEVFRFVKLLNIFDKKTNTIAALIATFLVAFSGIGIFVSKLATYDMPSFLLFFLGMNSFLKARQFSNGKYYFLAFLFLFLAFLTKIVIALFFPILFVIAFFMLKDKSASEKRTAIIYLFAPFFLASLVYGLFYWENLMTYIFTHKDLGKTEGGLYDILALIWRETYQVFLLSIPAGLLITGFAKARKMLLGIIPLALAVPVFHILLTRFATLDKHLYLVVAFLAVIVGYGIGHVLTSKDRIIGLTTLVALPIISAVYILASLNGVASLEHQWKNTYETQDFLRARIEPGDKVLTEDGATIALALYDIIFPPKSIVTFDWINYSGLETDEGYIRAVREGYFDFIELDGEFEGKDKLREDIKKNMENNYHLVHKLGTFEIYERNQN